MKFFYFSLLLLLILAAITPTAAQNFIVNNNGDTHAMTAASSALDGSGNITLRSAVEAATAQAGTHVISFAIGITTINLSLGNMNIGSATATNISINGPGINTLTVNQTTAARIFTTTVSANFNLQIQDMTLNYAGPATTFAGGGGALLAGGTNAVTILTNCKISNFRNQIGNGGGVAVTFSTLSHNLTVTNCIFDNNRCGGGGGGLAYSGLGTVNITGCTFSNNSAGVVGGNTGGSGGALNLTGQSPGGTYSVTKCTFINNTVENSTSQGGAIIQVNGHLTLNYNRFIGNTTAGANLGSVLYQSSGDVANTIDANNNWWGRNTGPAAGEVNNGGAPVTAPVTTNWLQLRIASSSSSLCSGSPLNTATLTASFLTNSAGSAVSVSNLTTLIGLPVSFGATLGSISAANTTIQAAGTAAATFTSNGTAGSASGSATVDGATASSSTVTVTAVTLPIANTMVTQTVGTNNNLYYSSCQLLLTANPSGAGPISGSVIAKVWVEGSVPAFAGQPFVARHYEITPAGGTTARVTLYFTQAEFTAFNGSAGSLLDLPANSGDATGKANLRIGKYSGTSGSSSGLPASYSGARTIIDPDDADILFDAPNSRWAVTFDVAGGFSGFIVQTAQTVLPVAMKNFYGSLSADKTVKLTWEVDEQQGIQKYIVEKSADAIHYAIAGTVTANSFVAYTYNFEDGQVTAGSNYYRLKIIDRDGKQTYSPVVRINVSGTLVAAIYPNPGKDKITFQRLTSRLGKAKLTDMQGKRLQTVILQGQTQVIDISSYPPGLYLLVADDGSTFKIIKTAKE